MSTTVDAVVPELASVLQSLTTTVDRVVEPLAPVVDPVATTVDRVVAPATAPVHAVTSPVVSGIVAPVAAPLVVPVADTVDTVVAPVAAPLHHLVLEPVADATLVSPLGESPVSAPAPSVGEAGTAGSAFTNASTGWLSTRTVAGRPLRDSSVAGASHDALSGDAAHPVPAGASPAPAERSTHSGAPWSGGTSPTSRTGGNDSPDRTHRAVASSTAVTPSVTPAATAPLGARVVGASENSGSRPSVTPD